MLEEELSMLREGALFKEGSLPLGVGAQVLCLENKMLRGLFQETKTTIKREMKNCIYSA